ncbi:conserved hypothetical protein [Ricinus communis]|uniref:Uncharacterized protein n=1 Tax=Ricinus communis TaxID=3988 RepID=B9T5N3_RICCO|nr:conserved hypothetical protein [Ricinus communis]
MFGSYYRKKSLGKLPVKLREEGTKKRSVVDDTGRENLHVDDELIESRRKQVRNAVARYANMKVLDVWLKKNKKDHVRAKCMPKCPWTLYVSRESRDNNITMKIYIP